MRQLTLILLTATIATTPAAAQNAAVPGEFTGSETNMATEATEAAPVNGLAADPALTAPATPPTAEAPGVTDATVTPDTGENSGGFPWGLLGLLGLVGLIGRFRA